MEQHQWINLVFGIIALLGGGVSTLAWSKVKEIDNSLTSVKKSLGEMHDSSKDRIAMISSRVDLMDYAKVSKEEMYQFGDIVAQKIEKAIEEKQRLRDQRTEDNYLRLEAKLEELVKEFRNSR